MHPYLGLERTIMILVNIAHLGTRQAVDSAFFECGHNTTYGAEVDDLGFGVAEVEAQQQIVCQTVRIQIQRRRQPEIVPRVESGFFPFLFLGFRRFLRLRCRSLLSVAENTNVCSSLFGAAADVSPSAPDGPSAPSAGSIASSLRGRSAGEA